MDLTHGGMHYGIYREEATFDFWPPPCLADFGFYGVVGSVTDGCPIKDQPLKTKYHYTRMRDGVNKKPYLDGPAAPGHCFSTCFT